MIRNKFLLPLAVSFLSGIVSVTILLFFSLPDGEKETEDLSIPVMTISHDCQIPGTVLQLAETKQSGLVRTIVLKEVYLKKLYEPKLI